MNINTTQPHIPTLFIRHKAHLHAIHLQDKTWFCARDLGHLMGIFLDECRTRKLAPDQRKTLWLKRYDDMQETLMVSESGAYALLIYHHAPHNGPLREWLEHHVVPKLRDMDQVSTSQRPTLSLMHWPSVSMSLLNWQSEPWIRLRDMPEILLEQSRQGVGKAMPWWRRLLA
ncbi:BRO-N domain-containing protein [Pseudomonas capsici]|uniref:BRO-N domain-containing protein n=1 Tax=Pseudomonas capsici TaxID=2810614 RepID=UPI0021F13415|nr:Bro-N domain-containing protein [Pseudomonas capsici]MCV4285235.1 Bro-N domain-containing protein [Pseudomonas capsici]